MKTHELFCNVYDCEVRVMITDAPPREGQATLHDGDVVCLEIGEQFPSSPARWTNGSVMHQ
jgi:hypothetical protein